MHNTVIKRDAVLVNNGGIFEQSARLQVYAFIPLTKILKTYYVTSTVLGIRDAIMNNTEQALALMEPPFWQWRQLTPYM